MRILAIRGRNLASLAREFEVDLLGGEIGGAGIFAICGPVGAGKSTLLDALCLALFDRTPRLSGRGGVAVAEEGRPEGHWLHSHDPRALLRRGAGDGHAQVDFTGRDGRRYRATWSVRRARRRPDGRVQAQEMSLEDLDRGLTVASNSKSEVLEAIRARLGLDFAQFCRSVLLAQGEFAAFLRASADERANLLESLTGADIYRRLSIAAHERRKQHKQLVDRLASQSQVFELLDAGKRQQLETEATRLAEQLRLNQLAVELAQGVVSWYGHAARLRTEEDAATAALQAAVEANREAEPRRERLRALARALPLVPRVELVIARQQAVVAATATRQAAERELVDAKEELRCKRQVQRVALADVLPAHAGEAPPLIADYERWRAAVGRWSRFDAEWRSSGTTVAAAEREVEAAGRAHQDAAASAQRAAKALQADEYRDLAAARRQLTEDRAALRAVAERLRVREQCDAEVARRREEVAALAVEQQRLAEGFEELVAAQHAADRSLQDERQRLEHLRARSDLAAFRSHLVEGAPCPLCGSPEHPEPATGDDTAVRRAVVTVDRAEAARDAARDAVRAREAGRRECERALGAAQKALQRSERAAEAAQRQWREIAAGDESLADREAALAARELAFAQLAERHEADREAASRTHGAEQRAMVALRAARDRCQRCVAIAAALAEAVGELAPGLVGVASWEEHLHRLGDRAVERLGELAAGEAGCRALAAAIAERERELVAHHAAVSREERELQAANDALATATAAERLTASDVREAAALGGDAIRAEQGVLQGLAGAEDSARAVLRKCVEIRRRHGDTNRPAIAEDDATRALEDTREARDAAARQLAEARAELSADDFMRRQRAEIEPRLRAAEAAFEVWATLDDLIGHSRGDAFAVFAQGLTLDLLLVEANRRLAELARRFRLEKNRGRDMDFVVVDLDLGGARRGLQSLSGGETFLVSLALALALATLAAPRSRVETLFLDEGFGTLDAHNLEAALGALDSLQASGCQIGIISHVEGIAERIGTVVDVLPEGGGQSRIRVRTG